MKRCLFLLAALFVGSLAAARTWTVAASGRKIVQIELAGPSAEDRVFVQERLKPAEVR